jgi:hypothetical protein
MNPPTAAPYDSVADEIHADASVVVAADGEDRRHLAEGPNQFAELA